jgi:hypothetical protein
MARPSHLRLMLLALVAWTDTKGPADSLKAFSIKAAGAAHVALGQSVAPLYGSWRSRVDNAPSDSETNRRLWLSQTSTIQVERRWA